MPQAGSSTPPGPQALLNNKKAMDAGSPTAQTAVTAVYTWGAAGLVSENISWLASTGNPGSLFYAYYPNGATLALTDINGAGQDVYLNSAYGEQWDYFGAGDANPFQFGGQAGYYTDQWSTLGFTLCGARWYVPNAGFWLNRDPAGYQGGDNLYRYCGDDPLAAIDPRGLQSLHVSGGLTTESILQGAGSAAEGIGHVVAANSTEILTAEGIAYDIVEAVGAAEVAPVASAALLVASPAVAYYWIGKPLAAELFPIDPNASLPPAHVEPPEEWQCFVAGTKVQVIRNAAPAAAGRGRGTSTEDIERVRPGDQVLSFDATSRRAIAGRVSGVIKLRARAVTTITLSDPRTQRRAIELTCTPDHPIYVPDLGFVPAGRLAVGNAVVTRAGPQLRVADVRTVAVPGGVTVYDLRVPNSHTFYVGTAYGGVLVHNCGHNHHVFPKQFRAWFSGQGVDIDKFVFKVPASFHLRGLHGRGAPLPCGQQGPTPGYYNRAWDAWILNHQDAKAPEIFAFAKSLLASYGITFVFGGAGQ
jgi:RHS repeat-associated protein